MELSEISKRTNLKAQKKRFWQKCKIEMYLTSSDNKKVSYTFTFLGSFKVCITKYFLLL